MIRVAGPQVSVRHYVHLVRCDHGEQGTDLELAAVQSESVLRHRRRWQPSRASLISRSEYGPPVASAISSASALRASFRRREAAAAASQPDTPSLPAAART